MAPERSLYHIRVLSFWIERGYGSVGPKKRFLYNIHVLSSWIKREYGLQCLEKHFLHHIIRILFFLIKHGCYLE